MYPCCSIISEECCLHLPSSMLAASPHSGSKGAEQYQASQLQSICSTKQMSGVCVCCLRFYLGLPDWGLCSPKCPGHSWTHSNEWAGIKWKKKKKNYTNKQIRLLTCQMKIHFNWLDRGSKPVALSLQSTVALAKKTPKKQNYLESVLLITSFHYMSLTQKHSLSNKEFYLQVLPLHTRSSGCSSQSRYLLHWVTPWPSGHFERSQTWWHG